VVDESFFLTVAGIAMSFAGFAGLMNTLRRRGEAWTPMDLYQLRIIVAYAIATLFGSLPTILFVGLSGQREGLQWLGVVMIVVSAALGVGNMLGDIRLGRGTAVRTRVRAVFATIKTLGLVAFLGTAVTGALSLYQVSLILMLAMPAGDVRLRDRADRAVSESGRLTLSSCPATFPLVRFDEPTARRP
jgi:hypothetical protein